jgi:raffinose/stachyose/melibiose transport system substrate-binding protein
LKKEKPKRRRKVKKLILLCLYLSAATALIFAGGSGESQESDSNEPITLTLWDIMVNPEEERAIKPAVDQWNAENPDIQIVRDSLDDESYKIKLKTAIAANEAPDLFFTWGAGFSQPFVDAGKILPLDGVVSQNLVNRAIEGTLGYVTYDDKLYGLPFSQWVGVLYCNQEMFDKYGVKIPETFTDLMNAVETFKENEIDAIAVGASERWTAMFYQNILALRTAGAKLSNDALAGKAPFDGPEFTEAAEKLKELVEAEAFNNGYMGMNYDEILALFTNGQIPMLFQGDWVAGDCELEDSAVKGKIIATHFPYIEGSSASPHDFLGGALDSFMISANTKHKEEAIRALEFLCETQSRLVFKEGMGLPVYKGDLDLSKTNRLTRQIVELSNEATGFTLAWDTFLVGEDTELHLDLVQELFANLITPAEFSATMQTINSK